MFTGNVTAPFLFQLNHDHALVIQYEKYNQLLRIHMPKFMAFIISVGCCMFRPPCLAIFTEVFLKELFVRRYLLNTSYTHTHVSCIYGRCHHSHTARIHTIQHK